MCLLNLLHIFSLYRRKQVGFLFDIMAVGKCDGKVSIFWSQLPTRMEYAPRLLAFSSYTRSAELEICDREFCTKPVQGGANIGLARKYILFA
jgi:hypothetical protein